VSAMIERPRGFGVGEHLVADSRFMCVVIAEQQGPFYVFNEEDKFMVVQTATWPKPTYTCSV
jgi:hypothetical protein